MGVCLLTDGFEPGHWATIMRWGHKPEHVRVRDAVLDQARGNDEVVALARENSLSVTIEDGLDWLRVVLAGMPFYRGDVPVWTRRALREVRSRNGLTNRALAGLLGMEKPDRLDQWVADTR